MRFTGEWDKIFIADGKFLNANKASYIGSRGWLGELRLNGEVITARNLINTILVQGFQHHYALIQGDVTEELMEMAAWLDLDTLNAIEYKNYLQKPKI